MYEFKHIVVDGWNVIHSHPKLKKLLTSGNQDAARAELSSLLAPIHDFGGSRITIVYDGTGEDISIVRRSQILTFSEVFTPSNMTADELIEQLCSTSKNPDRILVVSRDNLLRLTASSFGALSIAPEQIFEWSSTASSGLRSTAESNNNKAEKEWRKCNPLSQLDDLALDINEVRKSALISKHLKKSLKRAAISEAKGEKIGSKYIKSAEAKKKNSEPTHTLKSFAGLGEVVDLPKASIFPRLKQNAATRKKAEEK